MKFLDNINPKTLLLRILQISVLVCTLVVGLFLYWIIYDNNFNPPGLTVPIKYTYYVPQGGSFEAVFETTRYRDCYLVINREIVNEKTGLSFEQTYDRNNEASPTSIQRAIQINLPPSLPMGVYSYKRTAYYYCNPSNVLFGPIVVEPPKINFVIREPNSEYEWVEHANDSLPGKVKNIPGIQESETPSDSNKAVQLPLVPRNP